MHYGQNESVCCKQGAVRGTLCVCVLISAGFSGWGRVVGFSRAKRVLERIKDFERLVDTTLWIRPDDTKRKNGTTMAFPRNIWQMSSLNDSFLYKLLSVLPFKFP